jgi:hypothetical protein
MTDHDTEVAAAVLIFEARLTVEAVSIGLERLIAHAGASPVAAELSVLKRMNDQAAEALAALQDAVAPSGSVGTA